MKVRYKGLVIAALIALLEGCSGIPTPLGTRLSTSVPTGVARDISAEACGLQLLLLIPININDRMQRANQFLQEQAGVDFITDVKIQDSWTYVGIGTEYCTRLKAIRTKSS